MSTGIRLTGMVLSAFAAGEYDKRLVLLTKERGKITAFARGARRQGSTLLAAATPFSFGTFLLYEGRSAYTLTGAEITNYFKTLREDLEGAYYGLYFLEFASYYGRENLEASEMLNLLYAALRALEKKQMPYKLVRYVYEVRLMVINGEFPQDLVFDSSVAEGVRFALRFIIETPLQHLFSFTLREDALKELGFLQDQVRDRQVDRSFHSLKILETLDFSVEKKPV